MKVINGITHNITEDILGRITLKGKPLFSRKDYILVRANADCNVQGYSATITNKDLSSAKGKTVSNVEELNSFSEGDVVLINAKGEIKNV